MKNAWTPSELRESTESIMSEDIVERLKEVERSARALGRYDSANMWKQAYEEIQRLRENQKEIIASDIEAGFEFVFNASLDKAVHTVCSIGGGSNPVFCVRRGNSVFPFIRWKTRQEMADYLNSFRAVRTSKS